MKRSTQVSLVLMGAVGIGASAYALQSYNCPQPAPGVTADSAAQGCRSSSGGGSGSSRWHLFPEFGSSGSSVSSGSSATSTASPAASSSTSRGGFGSIGRAFASFGG